MTDEQKAKIMEKFKEGKYDVISFILDNSFNEEKHLNELLQNESNELKNMKNKK